MLDRLSDNQKPERNGEPAVTCYAFATKSRCPIGDGGCGSLHTIATTYRGRVQYRRCLDCGHYYKVLGWMV